jgi:integrase
VPALHIITGVRGRAIKPNEFSKRFRVIAEAAGLPGELQFRDLRRTAATEISAGGGRSEAVTGHVPGSPMLRVYEMPTKDAARVSQSTRNRK